MNKSLAGESGRKRPVAVVALLFGLPPLMLLGLWLVAPCGGPAVAAAYAGPHGGFTSSTQLCLICHSPHEATGDPIIKGSPQSALCFTCHNGTGSIYNIQSQMNSNPASNAMHPIKVSLPSNPGGYTYTPRSTAGIAPPGPYDCSQCHNPHDNTGNVRLLRSRYETGQYVTYGGSPNTYAACWSCHDANKIVADDDQYFKHHLRHIVDEQSPCTACHYSSHGVAHTELVKFNPAFVTANSEGAGPAFTDEGDRQGSCSLRCHGVDHRDQNY